MDFQGCARLIQEWRHAGSRLDVEVGPDIFYDLAKRLGSNLIASRARNASRLGCSVARFCVAAIMGAPYFSIRGAQGCVGCAFPRARRFLRPVDGCYVLRLEEVVVVRASQPRPIQPDLVERPQPIRQAGTTSFGWSHSKIRIACFVLLAVVAPATAGFAVAIPFVKWICLAWLAGIALLMQGLRQRAYDDRAVLWVDQRGIFDRRLMSRHINWQEIEAICPVNTDRNHTVDIKLRWPKSTLGETRWPDRVGAYCQVGYDVPAVTISLLLLDGSVSEMLDAIAQHRPDLLHYTNRAPLTTH
jgi:hypothetical protein